LAVVVSLAAAANLAVVDLVVVVSLVAAVVSSVEVALVVKAGLAMVLMVCRTL
jgi:hypothetical protein